MSVATALQARVQAATRPTRACLQLPRLVRGSPSVRASKIFARRGCAQRTIAPWLLAAAAGGEGAAEAPVVAVEGDIVTINWDCFDEDGEVGVQARHPSRLASQCPLFWERACLPLPSAGGPANSSRWQQQQ